MSENNTGDYDSTKKNFEETADNLGNEANKAANEFKEGWNEATNNGENLGIVIGSLGIHKFILGYTQEGIIQIVITIVTCGLGGIIGLIEGIIYLTKTDEEFYQTYQVGKKGWF